MDASTAWGRLQSRLTIVIVMVSLLVGLASLGGRPAEAFSWPYCGHGGSGSMQTNGPYAVWHSSTTSWSNPHIHKNVHAVLTGNLYMYFYNPDHYAYEYCSNH